MFCHSQDGDRDTPGPAPGSDNLLLHNFVRARYPCVLVEVSGKTTNADCMHCIMIWCYKSSYIEKKKQKQTNKQTTS